MRAHPNLRGTDTSAQPTTASRRAHDHLTTCPHGAPLCRLNTDKAYQAPTGNDLPIL
jgi:hypothetical protein